MFVEIFNTQKVSLKNENMFDFFFLLLASHNLNDRTIKQFKNKNPHMLMKLQHESRLHVRTFLSVIIRLSTAMLLV